MVVLNVLRADGCQKNVSVLRRTRVQDTLQHISEGIPRQVCAIEHGQVGEFSRVSTN